MRSGSPDPTAPLDTPSRTPRERKRRQYGTGSITQRPDGLWMGRLEAGYNAKGKRRRLTVYGETEAEAKQKLDRKRSQLAREGAPSRPHGRS